MISFIALITTYKNGIIFSLTQVSKIGVYKIKIAVKPL